MPSLFDFPSYSDKGRAYRDMRGYNIFQDKIPDVTLTPIYDIQRGGTHMAKRISIDEHALYHDIVEKLRHAQDSGLIKSLYIDEQSYTITALSEYGEWSLKLRHPPDPK
jgi:hypothetical protein